MYLIAGLGNPGRKYAGTRHNVGFMVLDYLAEKNNLLFTDSKWNAFISKGVIWDRSVLLLKPETFMNLSGTAVSQVANFYKLKAANIVIIHDDLDMEFGRIKMVAGGGDGGHKGIRSITEHLGTRDYPRLKVGIGRPSTAMLPEKYVLGKFDAHERAKIGQKIPFISDALRIFLQQGIGPAMNVVNRKDGTR